MPSEFSFSIFKSTSQVSCLTKDDALLVFTPENFKGVIFQDGKKKKNKPACAKRDAEQTWPSYTH